MIKFPTTNRITTVKTKKETLHECQRMEEAQGPVLEGRITFPQILALGSEGTTNTSREEMQVQTKEGGEPKDTVQPPPSPPERDTQIDKKIEGKDKHPERRSKASLQRKWSFMTTIHTKPLLSEETCPARTQDVPTHRAEGAKEMKHSSKQEKNIKKLDDSWRMCIDFKDLNKACLKDLYLLPEMDWKIESLMRNLEAYVDDIVIKSKTETEMIKDVEETLLTLKKGKSIKSKGRGKHALTKQPEAKQRLSGKLAALNSFFSKAAEKALPCLDTSKSVKQKGLSLDSKRRRSILGNEETDNGATNLNGPKEGRRTHGLPISGQQSS
ncbi:hypothetical protein Tco_0769043 [Tanacetum coccineum]|uniref:Reverse transcriptase domain-containing protein n=1 Tax=Tanacetum coccineum TaxID=301880 RepID=A0ABQ4ZB61_9ASTR